jgi:hypothetical protein
MTSPIRRVDASASHAVAGARQPRPGAPAAFAAAVAGARQEAPLAQGLDGRTSGRIALERARTVTSANPFDWDDYDVRSARITGSGGETDYRVEVNALDETATVYDSRDRVIVRFDEDGEAEMGEAWRPGFRLDRLKDHTQGEPGVDSRNSELILGDVKVQVFTGRSSEQMNRVMVYALSRDGAGQVQEDVLDLFAAPESIIETNGGRDFGAGLGEVDYPNGWPEAKVIPLEDDFSDEGPIAFTLDSHRSIRSLEEETQQPESDPRA